MKLYEINEEIESVIEMCTATETGEFMPYTDLESSLSDLEMLKQEKILNIACMIKSYEAEAKAHADEEAIQKRKKQVLKNKADRLREFLKGALEIDDKFNDSRISVAYRKNGQKKLVIDKLFDIIPAHLLKPFELDKTKLKLGVMEGRYLENAHLEPSDPSLVIK